MDSIEGEMKGELKRFYKKEIINYGNKKLTTSIFLGI